MSVIMEDVDNDSDYCEIIESEDDDSQCSDISGLSVNNQEGEEGGPSSRAAMEEFKIVTSEDIAKLQARG